MVALEGSTTIIPHEIVINRVKRKPLIDKVVYGIANEWGDKLRDELFDKRPISDSLGGSIIEVILGELDSWVIKGAKKIFKLQQGETDHKMTISIDDGRNTENSIYNDVVHITTGSGTQGFIDTLNGTKLTVKFGEISLQAKGPGSTKIKIGVEDSIGNLESEYILNIVVEDTEITSKVTIDPDSVTGEFNLNEDALKAELKLKQDKEREIFFKNPFMWFDSKLILDLNGTTGDSKFQLNISADSLMDIISGTATTMLTLDGKVANLGFDRDVLQVIAENIGTIDTDREVIFFARQLSKEEAMQLGSDRPTYEFSIQTDEKKISDFGDGHVYISLPYELKAGEDAEKIFIERINEDGTIEVIEAAYNSEDNLVTFTSDGFSYYRIVYIDKIVPIGTPVVIGNLDYGQRLSSLPISVVMTDETETVNGSIVWKSPDNVPVAGESDQAWVFIPDDDETYSIVYGTASIIVNKSIPYGTPTYDKITTGGKTLADANLSGVFKNSHSGEKISGALTWNDEDNTEIIGNKSYEWTFTPHDMDNYELTTGSIILYATGGNSGSTSGGGPAPDDDTPLPDSSTKTIGGSTVTTLPEEVPITNDDGTITLPGGGMVEVGKNDNLVTVEAPPGTVVGEDGGVVIPDRKKAKLTLSNEDIIVTVPGHTVIDSDGKIIVGNATAIMRLVNGTEFVLSEGSIISGNRIIVGAEGTSIIFDSKMTAAKKGTVIVIDNNVRLGYYFEFNEPFTDVEESEWFYNSVKYVYENNLFNGTSETTFEPNATITRAMMVTVLHRMTDSPVLGNSIFADVPDNTWYTDSINWAAVNNIVNGISDNLFAPNDDITREQMAVMLYRYSQFNGQDVSMKSDLAEYVDTSEISGWAMDAMKWANAKGLITGRGASILAPGDIATRAEIATVIKRYLDE